MITVYGRPDSSAVARVMWLLGELSLPCERLDWGGAFGGNDDPAYRAMQPAGRIPAVKLADGRSLWESNVIIRYFAAEHPEFGFMPADTFERAHAEAWMDWSAKFADAVSSIRKAYKPKSATVEDVDNVFNSVKPVLDILEKRLEGRDFIMGDDLTIADFGLAVWGHRYKRCPDEVPTGATAAICAWLSRLAERPAFQDHVIKKVSAGPQLLRGG